MTKHIFNCIQRVRKLLACVLICLFVLIWVLRVLLCKGHIGTFPSDIEASVPHGVLFQVGFLYISVDFIYTILSLSWHPVGMFSLTHPDSQGRVSPLLLSLSIMSQCPLYSCQLVCQFHWSRLDLLEGSYHAMFSLYF
jgi:hypothetical protein